MADGGEAAILLSSTGDGRPIACNQAALDLLGCDAAAFTRLDPGALEPLRSPGRRDLTRPDGSTVVLEVSTEAGWWAANAVEVVVARTLRPAVPAPTSLPAALLDPLVAALAAHEAGGGDGVALLFVEVDAGATPLAAVEVRLRDALRRGDLVAAAGDGAFAVVCSPIRGEIEAAGLAAALVDELALLAADVEVAVALAGDPGMTVADLRGDPAAAATAARSQGGARRAAFTAAAGSRTRRQAGVAESLRRALHDGELEVHYQPVIDLRDGAVRAVEALARWRPQDGPSIPPDTFIPVAERSGLIVELGEWVLRRACEFAAEHAGLRVAVNLSPSQVGDDLVGRVTSALDHAGLDADCLELELTESVFLEDPEIASDVLRSVTDLGVHLALDDFGTGYSSLQVLRRLPFDRLKVDRSFVRSVADTPADRELVSAVVGLARAVGVAVTAEGVETTEQAIVLADLGCDDAQGYLFAAPMSADECEVWLSAAR